ncbi:porin type major outer membrane protein [Stanieria sp. NIES-3757]|nr:porin type major outer membrane protein [Stanieria sp. NIES-3757]
MKINQFVTVQNVKNQKRWQLQSTTILFLGTVLLLFQGGNASAIEIQNKNQSQITKSVTTHENVLQQIDRYNQNQSVSQVSNVSQLRDVSPSDWAYEALRSLVERYGCIVGYPNQTFRGDRALSRYEFAAGLNACLNQMERLIAASEAVTREDLDKLQRLTEEFQSELTTLNGRVDQLEQRTAFLEDHQFSTTTKLSGEVIFSLASIFTGDDANGNEVDRIPVLGDRARLAFNTSFTGEDLLLTFFSTGNFPFFSDVTNTFEGQIGFSEDVDNDFRLITASYYFPLGDRTQVVVEGLGGFAYDFADTINPLDSYNDSGSGAISYFGNRNPIYNQVAGAGIGTRTNLGDNFEVSLGYLAGAASDPLEGSGLLNGPYSALGQVVFKPSDSFKLGLTYVHAYNASDTFAGSNLANFRTFTETEFGEAVPTVSNSYGVQASWQLSDRFILSGWGGYTNTLTLSTLNGTIDRGNLDIWNWAVTLAFPDLGKQGNLGGVVVGMEPKVTDSSVQLVGLDNTDRDTSLHVEAFYQYQLTDNIAITPGVIWITAPNHNQDNDDLVIGTLRSTFTF